MFGRNYAFAMRRFAAVWGVVVTGVFGSAGQAGESPVIEAPEVPRYVAATLLWENDSLGGTDKHYTNGTRFEFTLGATVDLASTYWEPVLSVFDKDDEIYATVFLGQNLYTPRDITAVGLIEDDRPYAGWLYSGVRFGALTDRESGERSLFGKRAVDYRGLELSLGVVGPWAQGGEVQTWFHDLINATEPLGWDNQIHNEVVFDTHFLRSASFRLWETPGGPLSFDVDTFYSVRAGMVQVSGGAGMAAVLGLNHKLGATPRRMSYPGPLARAQAGSDWEVSLFASMEGRGVAWNTFLDGNVFDDGSHTVDRRPLIWHGEAGLQIRYGHFVGSYIQVFRSEEFDGQDGIHEYGSGRIGFEFPW